jgi:Uncharacterised protein family (UPF0259)
MAMTATADRFQIGRVFSNAMGTLGRNAAPLAVFALVLNALPSLCYLLLFQPSLAAGQAQAVAVLASPFLWLSFLVGFIAYCLIQAAVTYITVVDLDGRRPDFVATIATAVRSLPRLAGLNILLALGLAVAFVLLVVPGIVLWIMWSVAGVALVAEGTGVVASFRRSRALTKGSRWQIFGIFLLFFVADLAVKAIVAASFGMSVGGPAPSFAAAAVNAVVDAAITLIFAVLIAAIYVELRTAKEGASTATLAAIVA